MTVTVFITSLGLVAEEVWTERPTCTKRAHFLDDMTNPHLYTGRVLRTGFTFACRLFHTPGKNTDMKWCGTHLVTATSFHNQTEIQCVESISLVWNLVFPPRWKLFWAVRWIFNMLNITDCCHEWMNEWTNGMLHGFPFNILSSMHSHLIYTQCGVLNDQKYSGLFHTS